MASDRRTILNRRLTPPFSRTPRKIGPTLQVELALPARVSLQHRAAQSHFEERGVSPSTSFFDRLVLHVDPSFEVRTFINGDALGRDVARDNGRLL